MSNTKDKLPAANARTFGTAIRRALKKLGLPLKVQCQSVSFSGFGHGESVFADIDCGYDDPPLKLDDAQRSAIASAILEVRNMPGGKGGGRGIVSLIGKAYPMGGSIGYLDAPISEPRTFYFNTGVQRGTLVKPTAKGAIWSTNDVMMIPFQCRDVPANETLMFLCDDPCQHATTDNVIVRELIPDSGMVSKYAYFRLPPTNARKRKA